MVKIGEKRKEIHLPSVIVDVLTKMAKKDKRSLKNFMEKVLTEKATEGLSIKKK